MDIQAIVSLDRTECAVQCNSKKRILEIIADIAAKQNENIDQATVLNSLMARERMGSTGIGNGIAIPHARMNVSDKAIAVLLQCQDPIEFDAIDNRPVDLLFALLVPSEQCKEHLKTLSCMAERLNDKQTLKQLRNAQSDQELYDIMIQVPTCEQ